MIDDTRSLGAWEYPWHIAWANIAAALYCLRSPFKMTVTLESVFIEDRGQRDRYGDPIYRERITWVGVTRRHPDNPKRRQIVRTFIGTSRFV